MKVVSLTFFSSLLSFAFLCSYSAELYAQTTTQAPTQQTVQTTQTVAPTPAKPIERKFSRDTLYALLTAEIAGSRQLYDVALSNYVQQARITRDPQVAARATMIARYLGATQTGLEMSLLWAEKAPKDKEAVANASLALMQAGRLQESFEMSRRLHLLGGEPLFQNIAASAANTPGTNSLTKPQRERLLQSFKNLLPRYNRDEQLLVGIGELLQQLGNFDEAMTYAEKALVTYPRSIPAAILEANLLHELKRDREAIAKMADLLTFYPDNISLRNQYAHILTHYDLALAQQQFAIIAKQQPKNADAVLSLGIIAMERKDYKAANKAFEKLLDTETHSSTGHYYLGRLAEAQQNWQEAIFNYLQVERGNDFLSATISLLDIFIKQGDFISAQQHMDRVRTRFPDQAESLFLLHSQALVKRKFWSEGDKVLNEALTSLPNNSKLLYARAMLYIQRNQKADAERDLRSILQFEPNNIVALNSLGYMLTDDSLRYREAEELLTKAHNLKPDDPVIIDSLGWLHYRQGKYAEAVRELRQAYTSYQEPAVAAHLGEVLWVTGAQEEARQIWLQGIKQAPDDTTIPATMKRLKAE
ncbi:MAG TPA: tetratricopeptide repeat protein [Cellvibrio sp.]|mgnify:CR=1 FL=1|nr:tetratricopeptide repeat protein [Cellvibrio sp.]